MSAFLRLFIVCASLLAGCSTAPSGRKQIKLLSDNQMRQLGDDSFKQLKKEKPVSIEPSDNVLVLCVAQRLLNGIGQLPTEWEVVVFRDETPNAFAIPGNKIGVHTGMLKFVQNESQLAAVIGHEIGHVIAHHGNERVSQLLVTQAGMQVAQIILGQDTKRDRLILAALGLGAQFGVLLPFSREQEREADRLGVEYMARSGFHPSASVELWNLMAEKSGSHSPPEFLSTHPSSASRIKELSALAPQFVPIYESVPEKPDCGSTRKKSTGPEKISPYIPQFPFET